MLGKYDFAIVASVANVRYLGTDDVPCEIQLKSGDTKNNIDSHTYHPSMSVRMCEFAERCRHSNEDVKLYGQIFFGHTNIVGIEYAV